MRSKYLIFAVLAVGLIILLKGALTPISSVKAASDGQLQIVLPPQTINIPQVIRFDGNDFTVLNCINQPCTANGYTVSTVRTGTGADQHYEITVSGIKKRLNFASQLPSTTTLARLLSVGSAQAYTPPPAEVIARFITPYKFKMTFQQLTQANVDAFSDSLRNDYGGEVSGAYIGNSDCTSNPSGAYLCTKTRLKLITPENPTPSYQTDLAAIRLSSAGNIRIEGNVAAPGGLSGFILDSNAIALGGTIDSAIGGKDLSGYLSKTTVLNWATIAPQLQTTFNQRTQGTLISNTDGNFNGTTWYGNASGSDPFAANGGDSFSLQPEGKLWRMKDGQSVTLSSSDANGNAIKGASTLVIDGNLTVNSPLRCDANSTRFGVIVAGDITFNTTKVGCGAYVALGLYPGSTGKITFNANAQDGDVAQGLFIAKGNVALPRIPSGPGAPSFAIRNDNYFLSQPTILFKEIINITFDAQ